MSSRCVSPEVLSTMTSHQRCHDNCVDVGRRRRAAVHGSDVSRRSPTVSRRYPIATLHQHRHDDRSTGNGSSCSERHVISGNDDVTRQTESTDGGLTTVHRRRRRTAFTNEQVDTRDVQQLNKRYNSPEQVISELRGRHFPCGIIQ